MTVMDYRGYKITGEFSFYCSWQRLLSVHSLVCSTLFQSVEENLDSLSCTLRLITFWMERLNFDFVQQHHFFLFPKKLSSTEVMTVGSLLSNQTQNSLKKWSLLQNLLIWRNTKSEHKKKKWFMDPVKFDAFTFLFDGDITLQREWELFSCSCQISSKLYNLMCWFRWYWRSSRTWWTLLCFRCRQVTTLSLYLIPFLFFFLYHTNETSLQWSYFRIGWILYLRNFLIDCIERAVTFLYITHKFHFLVWKECCLHFHPRRQFGHFTFPKVIKRVLCCVEHNVPQLDKNKRLD